MTNCTLLLSNVCLLTRVMFGDCPHPLLFDAKLVPKSACHVTPMCMTEIDVMTAAKESVPNEQEVKNQSDGTVHMDGPNLFDDHGVHQCDLDCDTTWRLMQSTRKTQGFWKSSARLMGPLARRISYLEPKTASTSARSTG